MTHEDSCQTGCTITDDRRGFLRKAMGVATAVFLDLGLSARGAAALTVNAAIGRRNEQSADVAYPVPSADGATIDKENQVILVRYQNAIYAFALSCPHQNTALRWLDSDKRFQCPKHKSKYQPDGKFISGRATRNMDRLPIRTDGKQVLVDIDRVFESDKDPAGWAAAVLKL